MMHLKGKQYLQLYPDKFIV